MDIKTKGIIRDPDSFNDIEYESNISWELKASKRNGVKKSDNDIIILDTVTTEMVDEGYLVEQLLKLGEITRLESYICHRTFRPTTRGSVRKNDGHEYFFFLTSFSSDKYLKTDVDNTISCLEYSGYAPQDN